jgi:heme oxygenase (biliverdin-IX-beta and delta-forming)
MQPMSTSDGRRDGVSPVRERLKRETADVHRRLETELGLLDPALSLTRYRQILELFFGFYAPLERGMVCLASAGIAPGFPLRDRTQLIESDLRSIGLSPQEVARLPRCTELPRLSSWEELAGGLYVIEGASLGGQFIAPKLRKQLGVAKSSGTSFLTGDGDGTRARWSLFLAWLEGLVRGGAVTDEIVTSARATFLAFAHWVERNGAQTPAIDGLIHGRSDGL